MYALTVWIWIAIVFVSDNIYADSGESVVVHSVLKRNNHSVYEFLHIAKNGGRAIKYVHNKDRISSPFIAVHGHRVRLSHVLSRNHSAVIVLRDPVERFQSVRLNVDTLHIITIYINLAYIYAASVCYGMVI